MFSLVYAAAAATKSSFPLHNYFSLQLSPVTSSCSKRSRVLKVNETKVPGGVKKLVERHWKAEGKRQTWQFGFSSVLVGEKTSEDNKKNTKTTQVMKKGEIGRWNVELTAAGFALLYFQIIKHLGIFGCDFLELFFLISH